MDSLLNAMIEFLIMAHNEEPAVFEPHPFIRPPSRSRVYLCPFLGGGGHLELQHQLLIMPEPTDRHGWTQHINPYINDTESDDDDN